MNARKIIYPFLIVIILLLDFFLLNNLFKPTVSLELVGTDSVNVDVYSSYEEQGVRLLLGEDVINENDYKVISTDDIDLNHLGKYTKKYTITYNEKKYEIKRTINVVDSVSPVIETPSDVVYNYYCNSSLNDSISYTAYDNYDGVISDKVTVNKEADKVTLYVEDSSKNNFTKTLTFEIKDKAPPVITLNGSATTYVKNGSTYNEEGAKIKDGCGRALDNSLISIEGSVDTSKNGTYEIKYSAAYDDMSTSITRKVIVYTPSSSTRTTYDGTGKTVYLTFDDGPCAYTKEFLDILDKYNIKATFFVTNQFPNYAYLIGEEARRGHSIAVHTYTHSYKAVYSSIENYVKDFNDMNNIIEQQTGSKTNMFRFPGGSSNTVSRNYSKGIMSSLASYMQSLGYEYYDWNVSSGDAAGYGTDRIVTETINGVHRNNNSVVLMHDIHKTTLNALPRILETLTSEGYTFKGLDLNSPKMHHGINN